ncbi:MAG: hypothetical protein KF802_15915 [Bdellovibrionaceae bacterium]|nr:hypothetical protein [Pseudobdellovibrionaceae bacterium]
MKKAAPSFLIRSLLFLVLILAAGPAGATPLSAVFTFQGRLLQADGVNSEESSSVIFRLQVRSPDGLCLLYDETHNRDMTGTSGVFALEVGQGTNSNVASLTLLQSFSNAALLTGSGGCSYNPSPGDGRRLRLSYEVGGQIISLPMDQNIFHVPYAYYSQYLGGRSASEFLQTNATATQAKIDDLTASATTLIALAAGTSPQYATPTYVNSSLAGRSVDITSLSNGQVLTWNSSQNKWIASSLNTGTVSSVTAGTGLSGGTITGSGTISLATIGSGGTAAKVTYDAYGRVTGGAALSDGDFSTITTAGKVSGAAITSGTIGGSTSISTTGSLAANSASTRSLAVLQATPPNSTIGVNISASAAQSSTYNLILPVDKGLANQFMKTDGNGALSWSHVAWASLTGMPTTLSGYGITDAVKSSGIPSFVSGTEAAMPLADTVGRLYITTDTKKIFRDTGSSWELITSSAGSGGTVTQVSASAPLTVSQGASTPTVALQNGASSGHALIWNGSAWVSAHPNMSQLRGVASAAQVPTGCTSAQVWSYQSLTDTFICANIAISSTQISGLGGAASLSVGTTAGTLAAGDDSRLTGALQANASAGGDLSGTAGAPTVGKIQGVSVSGAAPGNNQVLKYSTADSRWEPAADNNSGGTVTSVAAGTGLVAGTITVSGTLNVDVGTGANKIVQLDSSGRLPAVDGSQLTGVPIPFGNMEVYDGNNTFIVPPTVKRVFVQVWGGGGGGGGSTALGPSSSGGVGAAGRVIVWW